MPFDTLSPDQDDQQFSKNRTIPRQRFQFDAEVSGTGNWLALPAGIGDLLVSVEPTSGTARIEYTQDPLADVDAGTAVGKPWDSLDVSEYTASVLHNSVTAIRAVASASATFKVTA